MFPIGDESRRDRPQSPVDAVETLELQDVLDELQDFARDNDNRFLVVSRYTEMEEDTVAITGWSRRLTMSVDDFDRDQLKDFLDEHECRFDPEDFC